jgi:hypothetical protein
MEKLTLTWIGADWHLYHITSKLRRKTFSFLQDVVRKELLSACKGVCDEGHPKT